MWARRTKSITTAQMSIFKLVKLQSLVGKCWKTRKMKPGDVCEFVYTVYLYYARKKLHFRANFGLIQIHTKVLEQATYTQTPADIYSLYIQYLLTLFKWKVHAKRQTLIQEVLVPFAQQLTVQTASSKILI